MCKINTIPVIQTSSEDWIRFVIGKIGSMVPSTYSVFKMRAIIISEMLNWRHLRANMNDRIVCEGINLRMCKHVQMWPFHLLWPTRVLPGKSSVGSPLKFCAGSWCGLDPAASPGTEFLASWLLPSPSVKNHILVFVPPLWDCSENQWLI